MALFFRNISIVGLLFVTSCFFDGKDSSSSLNLFFSQSRHLELEPCGCSLGPKGGVVREFNFFQSNRTPLKEPSLYLVMGPTFSPDVGKTFQPSRKQYQVKAESLAKAFKSNQVNYVGAATEDTIWEKDYLEDLAKKGGFQWVSSNLYSTLHQKSYFSKYAWLEINQQKILITSLAAPPSSLFRNEVKNLLVQDPETSIKETISELSEKPSLILILTNLDRDTRLRVSRSISLPVLFLGSQEEVIKDSIEQVSGSAVLTSISQRAKGILKARIDLVKNGTQFFGKKLAEQTAYTLSVYESTLASNQQLLSRDPSPEVRKSIEAENQSRLETLEILKKVPLKPSRETFRIDEVEGTLLGPEWDLPQNILTPVVEDSKK